MRDKLDGSLSYVVKITGAPQEGVISPILMIYINDIANNLTRYATAPSMLIIMSYLNETESITFDTRRIQEEHCQNGLNISVSLQV